MTDKAVLKEALENLSKQCMEAIECTNCTCKTCDIALRIGCCASRGLSDCPVISKCSFKKLKEEE